MKKSFFLLLISSTFLIIDCAGQHFLDTKKFTRKDTLRGSIGPGRDWWNVTHYDITVDPDYNNKSIKGTSIITFAVTKPGGNKKMQIDMQEPMIVDNVTLENAKASVAGTLTRDGNAYFVEFPNTEFVNDRKAPTPTEYRVKINFHGNPRVAKNAPWDGGWIFTKDKQGRPWMTVACQGLGASVWYPCKDHQSDEPDRGATLTMIVADSMAAVGNGRIKSKKSNGNGTTTWTWEVKSPINNYNIVPYIGKYVTWHEDYAGEKGKLDCDYWVMDYNLDKAKTQFTQVAEMMKCFEHWMGPYPFYEDGYKLIETPHLGMEHQSAVAYGNGYVNGYRGSDLSGSGYGKTWDYIIIHESGHEWFANNITTNDIADMWVHEGITDYSETLFVECKFGNKAAGDAYTQGLRRNISNDRPVIGVYGVNQGGSGDMYNKGNNIMHMVREIMDNDENFRQLMRGMSQTFYHKTVNSKDIEEYMSKKSGKDLSKFFDQYLRTIKIPVLEYEFVQNDKNPDSYNLKFRWANVVDGFNMPVKLNFAGKGTWITPGTEFKSITVSAEERNSMPIDLAVDKNFYITVKKL